MPFGKHWQKLVSRRKVRISPAHLPDDGVQKATKHLTNSGIYARGVVCHTPQEFSPMRVG